MSTPNLFLIAAPRAGSTQLAYWMDSHPDISLSRVKEPNYFSAHEFKPDYVRSSHLNDVNPTQYVKSAVSVVPNLRSSARVPIMKRCLQPAAVGGDLRPRPVIWPVRRPL